MSFKNEGLMFLSLSLFIMPFNSTRYNSLQNSPLFLSNVCLMQVRPMYLILDKGE